MKLFWMTAGLCAGILGGLGALDLPRTLGWEDAMGPYMAETAKEPLLKWEAALSADLSRAPDDGTRVKLAIVEHNLSRVMTAEGHRGYAGKAADLLQAVVDGKAPDELKAVAHPYLGSARALQGNEDLNPVSKILFVNQGMDRLNEAVSRYGEASYLPLFLRANVASSLPDFFGKADVAARDLAALDAWSLREPARIPPEVQATVQNLFGDSLKKKKQVPGALAAWKKAVALDPQKKGAGKAAAASLDIYED
jgi:hypothetical protein